MEPQVDAFEVQEHRKEQREAMVYRTLNAALTVLAERGLKFTALFLTAVFFGIAIYEPSAIRAEIAGLFAAMVFLPILYRKGGGDER